MHGSRQLGRWALVTATLLVGAALVLTVWATHRGAQSAARILVRGHAEALHDAVLAVLRRGPWPPDQAVLADTLEALGDGGLTYLALLDPAGSLLAQAGSPTLGPPRLALSAGGGRASEPVEAGGRVRVVFHTPGRRRFGGLRVGGHLLIEFEPRAAADLRATARDTLVVGLVAAGAFLGIALLLVRWLLRQEDAERRREHERRLASLGQMSAILAHELRNPLASLKGNAQLLLRSLPEGERARAKADRVVSEAVRVEQLVNDLLEFARTGELRRSEVDPRTLLREVAASLDGSRVRLALEGSPALFLLDGGRLGQAISNLIENALEAGPGPVTVRAVEEGGALRISVADEGPGIAAEDLERVFEPFHTRRVRGTGLGLAVARRLVGMHGGTLTAANGPSGGAIFTAILPR